MNNDPLDMIREHFGNDIAPREPEIHAQRKRLDAAMCERPGSVEEHPLTRANSSTRRRRRRWVPASGLAVAAAAVATLVVMALQPSGRDSGSTGRRHDRSGLQLAGGIAGGAFAGIDLDTASASAVLHAAGASAAAGTPRDATGGWSYSRMESGHSAYHSTMERWISPDGERSFSIMAGGDGRHADQVSIHYEHLRDTTVGDVSWTANGGGPGPRRATWSTGGASAGNMLEQGIRLDDALEHASDEHGVRLALDAALAGEDLTYHDGMACQPHGACMSIGASPTGLHRVDAAESKRMYERGLLLQALAGHVYAESTTRAMYAFLATMPNAEVQPAVDGSNDVVLRYRTNGERPVWITAATLDGQTGRIVAWGPTSTRWVATGVATGPVVGGQLCARFEDACAELRQLATELDDDPHATFHGVRDWMHIDQVCDGLIREDGSTITDAGPPKSVSTDPKLRREAADCRRRARLG